MTASDNKNVNNEAALALLAALSFPKYLVRDRILKELEALGDNNNYDTVPLMTLIQKIWWEKRKWSLK